MYLSIQFSVQDAAQVCREFIARDPDELHFTVGAITLNL